MRRNYRFENYCNNPLTIDEIKTASKGVSHRNLLLTAACCIWFLVFAALWSFLGFNHDNVAVNVSFSIFYGYLAKDVAVGFYQLLKNDKATIFVEGIEYNLNKKAHIQDMDLPEGINRTGMAGQLITNIQRMNRKPVGFEVDLLRTMVY